jgi:hypothetical protein
MGPGRLLSSRPVSTGDINGAPSLEPQLEARLDDLPNGGRPAILSPMPFPAAVKAVQAAHTAGLTSPRHQPSTATAVAVVAPRLALGWRRV